MEKYKVKERVISLIENRTGFSKSEIKEDSNLRADLLCDELDIIEIIMDIEREFNISVDDDEFGKIKLVKGIIYYITNN